MGPGEATLDLSARPSVVMLVGLQGSGKTTTAGKIARHLLGKGHKPMLVAADVVRPAAVEQLLVIGRRLNVPVFHIKGMDPVALAKMSFAQARNVGRDVLIVDTAGRLAIDERLMNEVVEIRSALTPQNVLFVCDAMIGQDAVRTAAEFDRRLNFTGFVLTKLDGDTRGGAALSIKAVTGKPVVFLGQGEALDRLESFRPEGLAQRILGFGDVVGLVSEFEKHVDAKTVEADANKFLKGQISYDDFVAQIATIRKMGPLKDVIGRLPMFGDLMAQTGVNVDDSDLTPILAMVGSMTHQERRQPDVLNPSRMRRIARGSGHEVKEVIALHDRFLQMRKMMRGMGEIMGNPSRLAQMQGALARGGLGALGGMMGMPGMAPPPMPQQMSAKERDERRKKAKEARKARKKNRR
jgi:signal recognition particle subunit SRP54